MPETPQANEKPQTWYQIQAAANDPTSFDLYIYDVIGDWGISAKTFTQEAAESGLFNARNLNIHIHSPGGSVVDGFAIYNTLARTSANKTIYIDGLAASMASVLAMLPGATVRMPENAWMMIHKPWGGAVGNADDLRDYADWLDRNESMLISAYQGKTGKTRDEIAALLTDETWLDGKQAVELGFADQLDPAIDGAAQLNQNKTKEFQNMPQSLKDLMKPRAQIPAPTVPTQPVATTVPGPDPVPATQPTTPNADEIRAQVLAEESQRRAAIQNLHALTGNKFADLLNSQMADMTVTPQAAQAAILAEMGKNTAPASHAPAPGHVGNGKLIRDSVFAALMDRTGLKAADKADKKDNRFTGFTLAELARAALEQSGVSTYGMSRMEYIGLAFTHMTGDFGNVLMDVAHKAVLQGWDTAPETFDQWTRAGTLTDFKTAHRVGLGEFQTLDQVREGAEYSLISLPDTGAQIKLATYGNIFSISRQAIINDDLSVLSTIPQKMGAAARATIGDLVYEVLLTGNGPDGKALFSAGNSNLLTGADSALSIKALSKAKTAMRSQKALTVAGKPGRTLNIQPGYLLVPVALEDTALQLMQSTSVPDSGVNSGVINPLRGMATVISDPRLDAAAVEAWYLAANAGDTIEVAYLDGQTAPYLEQQQGFSVDGVATKVRIDAGVSALDHRGLVKSAGK